MRIPPSVDLSGLKAQLEEWTSEEGVSVDFQRLTLEHSVTEGLDHTNKWWVAFTDACTTRYGVGIVQDVV